MLLDLSICREKKMRIFVFFCRTTGGHKVFSRQIYSHKEGGAYHMPKKGENIYGNTA